jgi:acylphosphatase
VFCKIYFVAGRVQGVYYRATAARHARELLITGHVRNLPDGRVEVLAYGGEASHDEFVRRLWIGSSASNVTSVEAADVADGFEVPTDFITR